MNETNSEATEQQIQKVFVKDLTIGDSLTTVFKATAKQRLASRNGKPYVTIELTDRTGQVDARIFENVDAADAAFAVGDYLLIDGKVGHFHGNPQIVIEKLERLDPEPIDAADFAFTPPPPGAAKEAKEKDKDHDGGAEKGHKAARQRIMKWLDDPQFTSALDTLLRRVEKLEDRPEGRTAQPRPPRRERGERKPREADDGRQEFKARDYKSPSSGTKPEKAEKKAERDPGLPEGLAFKPLVELTAAAPAGNSSTDSNEG